MLGKALHFEKQPNVEPGLAPHAPHVCHSCDCAKVPTACSRASFPPLGSRSSPVGPSSGSGSLVSAKCPGMLGEAFQFEHSRKELSHSQGRHES